MTSLYIRIDSHRGKPMSWPFVGGWMEILSFVGSIDFFLLFHCTFHWFSSLPDNQKKKEKKRQKKNGPHVRLVCVDLLFHQSLFFLVLFVCVELLWIPETLGHLSAGRFFFIDGSLAFHGSAWLVSRCRGRRCLGRHLFFLSTHLIFTEYRVWLGFIGFYWVLLGFTGFYWVLPGFNRAFTEFLELVLERRRAGKAPTRGTSREQYECENEWESSEWMREWWRTGDEVEPKENEEERRGRWGTDREKEQKIHEAGK